MNGPGDETGPLGAFPEADSAAGSGPRSGSVGGPRGVPSAEEGCSKERDASGRWKWQTLQCAGDGAWNIQDSEGPSDKVAVCYGVTEKGVSASDLCGLFETRAGFISLRAPVGSQDGKNLLGNLFVEYFEKGAPLDTLEAGNNDSPTDARRFAEVRAAWRLVLIQPMWLLAALVGSLVLVVWLTLDGVIQVVDAPGLIPLFLFSWLGVRRFRLVKSGSKNTEDLRACLTAMRREAWIRTRLWHLFRWRWKWVWVLQGFDSIPVPCVETIEQLREARPDSDRLFILLRDLSNLGQVAKFEGQFAFHIARPTGAVVERFGEKEVLANVNQISWSVSDVKENVRAPGVDRSGDLLVALAVGSGPFLDLPLLFTPPTRGATQGPHPQLTWHVHWWLQTLIHGIGGGIRASEDEKEENGFFPNPEEPPDDKISDWRKYFRSCGHLLQGRMNPRGDSVDYDAFFCRESCQVRWRKTCREWVNPANDLQDSLDKRLRLRDSLGRLHLRLALVLIQAAKEFAQKDQRDWAVVAALQARRNLDRAKRDYGVDAQTVSKALSACRNVAGSENLLAYLVEYLVAESSQRIERSRFEGTPPWTLLASKDPVARMAGLILTRLAARVEHKADERTIEELDKVLFRSAFKNGQWFNKGVQEKLELLDMHLRGLSASDEGVRTWAGWAGELARAWWVVRVGPPGKDSTWDERLRFAEIQVECASHLGSLVADVNRYRVFCDWAAGHRPVVVGPSWEQIEPEKAILIDDPAGILLPDQRDLVIRIRLIRMIETEKVRVEAVKVKEAQR